MSGFDFILLLLASPFLLIIGLILAILSLIFVYLVFYWVACIFILLGGLVASAILKAAEKVSKL